MTRSKINGIRDVCKEARHELDNLGLDYFQFDNDGPPYIMGIHKNYVNLDIDTLWVTDGHERNPYYWENCELFCGQC